MDIPPPTSASAPDLAHLRAWLEERIKAFAFVELVAAILSLIVRMQNLNAELVKQLGSLRRKRPRSETLKRIVRQLVLPLEGLASVFDGDNHKGNVSTAAKEPKPKKSRAGKHPGRAALPARLPRVQVFNNIPAEQRLCPICGSEMKTVGHESCEILDIIPAQIVVIQRLDERVACPHDDAIVSARTPPAIVERGKLSDTLIIEAVADKFIEHLPVERQCRRFADAGVHIAPQTLGRSVGAAIDLLKPIADLIAEQTRGPGLLGTDATSLPVLDRRARLGIRYGTISCWTNAGWVTFDYTPAGDADSILGFLRNDLARTVQCDGTSIMNDVERAGGARPGCWSHGRRGLADAALAGDSIALHGLELIQPLFRIERESTLAGETAPQRLARRIEKSKPVLESIRNFVDQHRGFIPPKTPLGKALGYLHRQWKRLTLFLEDGNIEITNNRRERELRRLVLGRRNWLFTWLDEGGERTAAILTILATCISHEVNPRAYLHLVAKARVNGWPIAELRDLLPDRMLASHPELFTGEPSHSPLPSCPSLPAMA